MSLLRLPRLLLPRLLLLPLLVLLILGRHVSPRFDAADAQTTAFPGITAIITDFALQDAPERFTPFINLAIADFQAMTVPDSHASKKCVYEYTIYGSTAVKNAQVQSLKVVILSTTTIQITGSIYATIDVKVDAAWVCLFIHHTWCNNMVQSSATVDFTIDLTFAVSASGGITITPSVVYTVDGFQVTGCSKLDALPGFIRTYLVDELENMITNEVNKYIQNLEQPYAVPQLFNPYADIVVSYQFNALDLTPSSTGNGMIKAKATMSVGVAAVSAADIQWFQVTDPVDATLAPPFDWTTTLNPNATSDRSYLLEGVRLSSTLIQAIWWATTEAGVLSFHGSAQIKDANTTLDYDFSEPLTAIPATDIISFEVASGFINMTCRDRSTNITSAILAADFENLLGNATVYFSTSNPNAPGIAGKLLDFDTSQLVVQMTAPAFPFPQSSITELVAGLIKTQLDNLNALLKDTPFVIPPPYNVFFTNAEVHAYNQQGNHGYLDMTTWCDCNEFVSHWPTCHFSCGSGMLASDALETESDVDATLGAKKPEPGALDALLPPSVSAATRGLYMSVFSSLAGDGSNAECTMSNLGDELDVWVLPETANGACALLYMADDGNTTTSMFYSLQLDASGTQIQHLCLNSPDASCHSCALSLSGTSSDWKHCIAMDDSTSIVLSLPSSPCFGPALNPPTSAAFAIAYNMTTTCAQDLTVIPAAATMVLQTWNIGNVVNNSTTQCLMPKDDVNGDYFQLTSSGYGQTRTFTVSAFCGPGCDPIGCNLALSNVLANQCVSTAVSQSWYGMAQQLVLAPAAMQSCAVPLPPPGPLVPVYAVVLLVLTALVIVAAVVYKYRYRIRFWIQEAGPVVRSAMQTAGRAVRAAFLFALQSCRNLVVATYEWIVDTVGKPTNLIGTDRENAVLAFLTGAVFLGTGLMCFVNNPLAALGTSATVQSLGVDASDFNMQPLRQLSEDWPRAQTVLCLLTAALFSLLCILRFSTKRWSTAEWTRAFFATALATIVWGALLVVIPGFAFEFMTALTLTANNSTFIQSNANLRDGFDTFVGYGFTSIAMSFVADHVLFLETAIAPAFFFALATIVWWAQSHGGLTHMSLKHANRKSLGRASYVLIDDDPGKMGNLVDEDDADLGDNEYDTLAVSVVYMGEPNDLEASAVWSSAGSQADSSDGQNSMSPSDATAVASGVGAGAGGRTRALAKVVARMRIQAKLVHFIFPVSNSITMVVVYQTVGASGMWAAAWFALWLCSAFLTYRLDAAVRDALRLSQPVSGIYIFRMVVFYLIVMASCMGVILEGQANVSNNSLDTELPLIFLFTGCAAIYSTLVFYARLVWLREQEAMAGEIQKVGYLSRLLWRISKSLSILLYRGIAWPAAKLRDLIALLARIVGYIVVGTARLVAKMSSVFGRSNNNGDSPAASPSKPSLFRKATVATVYFGRKAWHLISEFQEQLEPLRCGLRITGRRVFLVTGVLFFAVKAFSDLHDCLVSSFKQEFIDELSSMGIVWPNNSAGGDIFDHAFELLEESKWASLALLLLGWVILVASMVCDLRWRDFYGLTWSRRLGFASLPILYIASVAPVLPDYLNATKIDSFCPDCGPQFDAMVHNLAGDAVGLVCGGIAIATMLALLLLVSPSLVRASALLLLRLIKWEHKSFWAHLEREYARYVVDEARRTAEYREIVLGEAFSPGCIQDGYEPLPGSASANNGDLPGEPLPVETKRASYIRPEENMLGSDVSIKAPLLGFKPSEQLSIRAESTRFTAAVPDVTSVHNAQTFAHRSIRTLRGLLFVSALVSPLMTLLPFMFLYQLFRDQVLLSLLLVFWTVPVFTFIGFKTNQLMVRYFSYLVAYMFPLIGMAVYIALTQDFVDELLSFLSDPTVYVELCAEIAIANVVLSDLLVVWLL
ncbi:hypothetical protein CAOG_02919 [Capsaspora owczarzaki ATCC 30864]|uniref:Uncharacterized protein n=1 Tax=Capsaspora owczarzaki (strain ATCC 30864) TaxID=595528 RepID=A0A0D2WNA5_CAPO3|nr:hypothetical protein CAOG_02919 [Capsaspora owczarzaki ATCC 30864]KJE91843.1 hypothetical protein CAOG_002919 [Capsaspora owczarzaki ATCC 30864]|eukprot:XP_004363758.1 hypothetical protein CAOG_02919 [Capsaspora owczarzaki ATCC 30864]